MKAPHSCFVIMPFCETEHEAKGQKRIIAKSQWDYIFEKWIKRAVESYPHGKINCKRSPAKPGSFIKGIVVDLSEADLVVADLTGARPNVYYELGIRHALRIGTIIITQDFDALPSDLSNYFVFGYDYSDKDYEYEEYYSKFERKMHETLKAWDDAEDPSDNPVSDFLGIKYQLIEKDLEQEKEYMQRILGRLHKHFLHNFGVCETLSCIMMDNKGLDSIKQAMIVDVFPIDLLYSRLSGHDWKILKGAGFDQMEDIIVDHRRMFNEISLTIEKIERNLNSEKFLPEFMNYLVSLLEKAAEAKQSFDKDWDTIVQSIGSIKLQKMGSEPQS